MHIFSNFTTLVLYLRKLQKIASAKMKSLNKKVENKGPKQKKWSTKNITKKTKTKTRNSPTKYGNETVRTVLFNSYISGDTGQCLETICCHKWGSGRVLLSSSGQRPEMLLNIVHIPDNPLQQILTQPKRPIMPRKQKPSSRLIAAQQLETGTSAS